MSAHHRMVDVLALDGLAGVAEFAVMVILVHHCNGKTGLAWPSVPYIAARARLSESTARRALQRLQAAGLIEPVGARKGGRGQSVKYRLRLPSVTAGNPVRPTPLPRWETLSPRTETLSGTLVNPVTVTPEPLMNHIEPCAPAGAALEGAPPVARNPDPESGPKPNGAALARSTLGLLAATTTEIPKVDQAEAIRRMLAQGLDPATVVKTLATRGVTLEDVRRERT